MIYYMDFKMKEKEIDVALEYISEVIPHDEE